MEIMKKPGAIAPIHQHNPSFKHFSEAALHWHQFGFDVIPIVPLLKRPAVKWDAWLEGLSPEKIAAHWAAHPDHEVGFIVGERFLILDADSPASVEALHSLEKEAGIPPLMVVTTKRGEHHYFGREVGTVAKADSFSTSQYPDCIDVKTGRSLVILPPSTGKTVKACWVASAAGLFKVEQDFIDLVFHHNGRQAPRLPAPREPAIGGHEINSKSYGQIAALLKHIDPEEGGYDAWVRIGMAIHAETAGSDDGLDLFDQWSSDGATYPGRHAIEAKWRSFNSIHPARQHRSACKHGNLKQLFRFAVSQQFEESRCRNSGRCRGSFFWRRPPPPSPPNRPALAPEPPRRRTLGTRLAPTARPG